MTSLLHPQLQNKRRLGLRQLGSQLQVCPSTANQRPSAARRLTQTSQRRVEPFTYNNLQQHFCIFTCMSNSDLTSVLFLLLLLVGLAQLLGYLFVKMRQPKVIGEILAGIVLARRFWDGFKSDHRPFRECHSITLPF